MNTESNRERKTAEQDWTIPVDGVINVPDRLDKLFNRLGTQLRFHTISGKGEAETVASMTKIADDHASQELSTLKEENDRLQGWKESMLKIWGPVIDWGQSREAGLLPGTSISDEVLKRSKEYNRLKEENERLQKLISRYSNQEVVISNLRAELERQREAQPQPGKTLQHIGVDINAFLKEYTGEVYIEDVRDILKTFLSQFSPSLEKEAEPVEQWISVDDRWPEMKGEWSKNDFLVITPYTYHIGRVRRGSWVDMDNRQINEVIYYMPLPQPPVDHQSNK